jgi:hypothetical protein
MASQNNPLDLLNKVTQRYITTSANAKKLVDNIFTSNPFFSMDWEDESDPFTDWVREVRAEAGIVDPPPDMPRRGAAFRGGVQGLAEVINAPISWSATGPTYEDVVKPGPDENGNT